MKMEEFMKKPASARHFLHNVKLVNLWTKEGHTQTEIARNLGVSDALISHYRKVAVRWPTSALKVIHENEASFPGKVLTALAGRTFSDLRGGDPARKRKKPSLLATVLTIADGRQIHFGESQARDTERILMEERLANQELRQRVRDLEGQQQKSHWVKGPPGPLLRADVGYLQDVLIHKNSARVELDRQKHLVLIFCGTKDRFEEVVEMLL
ncbi:MAG TPA: hypothetical protein VE954_31065 [Oligoflexus sp.]|uniref:hypothetical protein n=1 Tax=Oligoflexus sp. TaxID=1971216 RepID=UPI002D32D2F8|nr:hypothetical protein [Oligoflexus sp.]HYX37566.1 hypothetical protein [Oligoflexus sp.]